MNSFFTTIKAIVDSELVSSRDEIQTGIKSDGSIVTPFDIAIQERIKDYVDSEFPGIETMVLEESFSKKEELINCENSYLILDPIDGTENFASGLPFFGTAISLNWNSTNFDMIYLPKLNKMLTNHDTNSLQNRIISTDLQLYSTKCLRNSIYNSDSIRVFGCSAYMFFVFLTGMANSYHYCQGAKLWDCYTGLRLAYLSGAKISLSEGSIKEWFSRPTFKTEFKIKW